MRRDGAGDQGGVATWPHRRYSPGTPVDLCHAVYGMVLGTRGMDRMV